VEKGQKQVRIPASHSSPIKSLSRYGHTSHTDDAGPAIFQAEHKYTFTLTITLHLSDQNSFVITAHFGIIAKHKCVAFEIRVWLKYLYFQLAGLLMVSRVLE